MRLRCTLLLAGALLAPALSRLQAAEVGPGVTPPNIRHDPVTAAVQGQPVYIRAVVTDDSAVQSVTLLYGLSKDAAAFKVAMQGTGGGVYLASIPAGVLSGARAVTYYIEAVDDQQTVAETPWYTIRLAAAALAAGRSGGAAPRESSWTKPALYAGGAAALIGGGAWLIAGSGGDSGGSSGGGSTTNAGTYAGSVTVALEFPSGSPTTTTRAMSITIASSGTVSSDTLHPGQTLEGRLTDSNFTLVAAVAETNLTGEIRYSGTVVGGRIVGQVEGTARKTSGDTGTYSGTFYASRR